MKENYDLFSLKQKSLNNFLTFISLTLIEFSFQIIVTNPADH